MRQLERKNKRIKKNMEIALGAEKPNKALLGPALDLMRAENLQNELSASKESSNQADTSLQNMSSAQRETNSADGYSRQKERVRRSFRIPATVLSAAAVVVITVVSLVYLLPSPAKDKNNVHPDASAPASAKYSMQDLRSREVSAEDLSMAEGTKGLSSSVFPTFDSLVYEHYYMFEFVDDGKLAMVFYSARRESATGFEEIKIAAEFTDRSYSEFADIVSLPQRTYEGYKVFYNTQYINGEYVSVVGFEKGGIRYHVSVEAAVAADMDFYISQIILL